MKRLFSTFAMAILAGVALFLAGCSNNSGEKQLYTCGMHPRVVQDHPGNCPICGMKLMLIHKNAAGGAEAATNSSAITVDPVTMQTMNLRTTEIVRGPLRKTIRT